MPPTAAAPGSSRDAPRKPAPRPLCVLSKEKPTRWARLKRRDPIQPGPCKEPPGTAPKEKGDPTGAALSFTDEPNELVARDREEAQELDVQPHDGDHDAEARLPAELLGQA